MFRKTTELDNSHNYATTQTPYICFRCMFFRFVTMSNRKEINEPLQFLGFQSVNMILIVNFSTCKPK
jgi:hypothetical protein